jgi:hypothetical protein
VSYVRSNFVYGREFLGDADLAAQTERWLEQTANSRVHGTTGEVPQVRLERDERAVLLPLAPHPYRSVLPLPPSRALGPVASAITRPLLTVERRSLATYAALVEAAG